VFEVPGADAWHLTTPLLSPSLGAGPDGKATAFQPTTQRTFEVGGNLYGLFAVYATPGEPDSVADRLSGSWTLRRTGSAVPERSGSLPLTGSREGEVVCGFSLPLTDLAPGEYELALRVRDDLERRELESVEILTLARTGDAGRR
jgi:hypothetical protein